MSAHTAMKPCEHGVASPNACEFCNVHDRDGDLVGDMAAIADYCRRVLAGEQDTAPTKALQHIHQTATAALSRSAPAESTSRGEGR